MQTWLKIDIWLVYDYRHQNSRVSPDLIPEQQSFLGAHHGYREQPQVVFFYI